MPTSCIISTARSIASLWPTFWCSCTASAIWSPTVNTGFSDVIGSWKIIEMSLPRIFSSSLSSSVARSRPSKRMREPSAIRPGRSTRRITESAVTDFPEPDSPTTPSVPPCAISKSTPSTARRKPSRVSNPSRSQRKEAARSRAPLAHRLPPGKAGLRRRLTPLAAPGSPGPYHAYCPLRPGTAATPETRGRRGSIQARSSRFTFTFERPPAPERRCGARAAPARSLDRGSGARRAASRCSSTVSSKLRKRS